MFLYKLKAHSASAYLWRDIRSNSHPEQFPHCSVSYGGRWCHVSVMSHVQVVVRLGRQRWRIRGRIESDDTQAWDEEEMIFLPHIYHNFEIKVTHTPTHTNTRMNWSKHANVLSNGSVGYINTIYSLKKFCFESFYLYFYIQMICYSMCAYYCVHQ